MHPQARKCLSASRCGRLKKTTYSEERKTAKGSGREQVALFVALFVVASRLHMAQHTKRALPLPPTLPMDGEDGGGWGVGGLLSFLSLLDRPPPSLYQSPPVPHEQTEEKWPAAPSSAPSSHGVPLSPSAFFVGFFIAQMRNPRLFPRLSLSPSPSQAPRHLRLCCARVAQTRGLQNVFTEPISAASVVHD